MTALTLSWLTNINSVGTQSQLIYNRLVSVHRMKTVAGSTDNLGNVGYSGAEQSLSSVEGELVLFTGLAAAIQMTSAGRTVKRATLPADATTKPTWFVYIPNLAVYSIRDRDIVIDDEGYRYEVSANEWAPLNYRLSTVRLEG